MHTHIGEYGKHWSPFQAQETITRHPEMLKNGQEFTPELGKKKFSVDLDVFLKEMDEATIEKAVVLAMDVSLVSGTRIPDEYVYDFVKKHSNRLIGFAGPLPIDARGKFNADSLKEFEKAITEYGFKGLKLLPPEQHYYPHDKAVYPFYEKADELGAAVMLHQGGAPHTYTFMKYAHPYLLQDIAYDFPNMNICVAHMGYPWTEELLALMRAHTNVWADISGMCARPIVLTWDLVMAKEYDVLNRVMWGTDYPTCRPATKFIEWVKTGLNEQAEKSGWLTFSNNDIEGLLGNNARKFLEI